MAPVAIRTFDFSNGSLAAAEQTVRERSFPEAKLALALVPTPGG